jgi:hypothetical protein
MKIRAIHGACVAVAIGIVWLCAAHQWLNGADKTRAADSDLGGGRQDTPANTGTEITSSNPSETTMLSNEQFRELLRLRNEVEQLRRSRDEWARATSSNAVATVAHGKILYWSAKLTPEQSKLVMMHQKLADVDPKDGRRPRIENNELVLVRRNADNQPEIFNPTQEPLVLTVSVRGDDAWFGSRTGSMGTEVLLPPDGRLIVPDLPWTTPKHAGRHKVIINRGTW